MPSGPTIRRHQSKQDYRTERAFLVAVRARLGIVDFTIDLAADRRNRVTREYFSKANSALAHRSWHEYVGKGWGWLNPPFDTIPEFAERAARTALHTGKVAMLVPASVGSNWFRDYVFRHALVLFLNGRITFEGESDPYPKNLMLCLYGHPFLPHDQRVDVWTWKPEQTREPKRVRR